MAQKALQPVPEGMNTVTPYLFFNGDCKEAISFYKKALNAELVGEILPAPDGKTIWHAMIKIGDSNVMMGDSMPGAWEKGPLKSSSVGMMVYVKDCDETYKNAIEEGAEELEPMMDAFWGDRMGKVKDPFGHTWAIASHKWIYTEEEMQQKQKEMMENMPQ